jgi:hypothetical protein
VAPYPVSQSVQTNVQSEALCCESRLQAARQVEEEEVEVEAPIKVTSVLGLSRSSEERAIGVNKFILARGNYQPRLCDTKKVAASVFTARS